VGLLTLAVSAHLLQIPEFDEARRLVLSRAKRVTG
jgi:hypothetical protein